ALEYVRRHWSAMGEGVGRVELLERRADEWEGVEEESYDVVVINSVIQYFPSLDYLRQVLAEAMKRVAPGGALYVGDVRNYAMEETFAASVELYQAAGTETLERVSREAKRQAALDEELVVHPGFFTRLRETCPEVRAARVMLKSSRYANELSKY